MILDSSSAVKVKLFDTLKEFMLSAKARDIFRFFAAGNVVENGLLRSFGSVDKIPLSLGNAGLVAQSCHYLIAIQSIEPEFAKPKLEPLMSLLRSTGEKAPEEPLHFAPSQARYSLLKKNSEHLKPLLV